jgi:UDP-N-acetylmuramyl pentapeptide phosphotransferase/UDP-N-acetylglucosamine-1-phosphate transferase
LELIVIPRLLLISYKKKLFDEPDVRKLHNGSVSRLGGATFMPIILFAICITVTILLYIDPSIEILQIPEIGIKQIFLEFAFLFSSLILLFFIGIKDDLIGASYRSKFVVQVLCGIFLVMSKIWINDFNGLLGFNLISPWIGYPLTVLIIVFIINAINLIDGIDGLASGLSIIAFAVLSYGFYQKGYLPFAIISMSSLGCLCAFFYYNVFGVGSEKYRRKKIFMGDTGSLAIGMILAYLLIRYTMSVNTEDGIYIANFPNPLIMFSIIIIPCFDAVSVAIGRIRRGLNPFKPDRSHLHHKFMRIGFSSHLSLIIIISMSAVFISMNFGLIRFLQIKWILLIDVIIYALIHIWLGYKLKLVEKQTKILPEPNEEINKFKDF